MSKFNPEKLSVEFRRGVNAREPVIPRRYTLTHSDETAELFLYIGANFALDKVNSMRDEVLGEWIMVNGQYFYNVYLEVDGHYRAMDAAIRNFIFRRELPLALEAIRYGDRVFFHTHPELDYVPIMVHFRSYLPYYNRVENWGKFADYR